MTTNTTCMQRWYGLDLLRSIAMLSGIFFHSSLFYAHISAYSVYSDASVLFDIFASVIHAIRMPLFFMLAGFFACHLTLRYGLLYFFYNRTKRILIPFLFSFVLLVPLIIYEFLWMYRELAISNDSQRSLDLGPPTFHLWFLELLYIFYLLMMIVGALLNCATKTKKYSGLKYNPDVRIVIPFILIISTASVWTGSPGDGIVEGTYFIIGWRGLVYYGLFFVAGLAIRYSKTLSSYLITHKGNLLILGLISTVLFQISRYIDLSVGSAITALDYLIGFGCDDLSAWLMSGALIGYGLASSLKPNPLLTFLSSSAYWSYLVHLPILLYIQTTLSVLNYSYLSTFLISSLLTVLLCSITFLLFVKNTFIGQALNGRRS